jgi:hypothetical protein
MLFKLLEHTLKIAYLSVNNHVEIPLHKFISYNVLTKASNLFTITK